MDRPKPEAYSGFQQYREGERETQNRERMRERDGGMGGGCTDVMLKGILVCALAVSNGST